MFMIHDMYMTFPSGAAAKRFPTYEHIVEAGLMTESELEQITILQKVNCNTVVWVLILMLLLVLIFWCR